MIYDVLRFVFGVTVSAAAVISCIQLNAIHFELVQSNQINQVQSMNLTAIRLHPGAPVSD